MPLELSTTEKQKQACKWFAARFVQEEGARHFMMLRNGWTPAELGIKKSNLQYRIDRYARYHIFFEINSTHQYVDSSYVEVLACNEAAEWADGTIILNLFTGKCAYTTIRVSKAPPSSFGINESASSPAPLAED
jgi:hypothetical protein